MGPLTALASPSSAELRFLLSISHFLLYIDHFLYLCIGSGGYTTILNMKHLNSAYFIIDICQ